MMLGRPLHPFSLGDWLYTKSLSDSPLAAKWKGPLQVILSTPSCVKVEGHVSWIHYTCIKQASPPQDFIPPPPLEPRRPSRDRWAIKGVDGLQFLFQQQP